MRLKRMGSSLGTAMVLLAVAAGLMAGPQALAQTPTISAGIITIGPGGEGPVDLAALDIAAPGVGAWTVDVHYDPSVVTAVSCVSHSSGLCNANFQPNVVRSLGATNTGLEGDTTLAQMTFACKQPGATSLTIVIERVVDPTIGAPQPIDVEIEHGTVTCTAASGTDLLGDVNCDGFVTSLDALLVLQFTAALIDTLPCPENGDINDDGATDSLDAAIILQIDAGLL